MSRIKPARPARRARIDERQAIQGQQLAAAFRDLMRLLILGGPTGLPLPVMGVLSAYSCGLVLLDEAISATLALQGAVSSGTHAVVFFNGKDGRRRMLCLSPFALAARNQLKDVSPSRGEIRTALLTWLRMAWVSEAWTKDDNALQQALERGAQEHWSLHVPRLLVQDATGQLHIQPLRPQALARLVTGEPLLQSSGPVDSCMDTAATRVRMAPESAGFRMHLVVEVMTKADSRNLSALRSTQLAHLRDLMNDPELDRVSGLLLLVAMGLCERGTVKTSSPSHSITSRYVRELAEMFDHDPELAASLIDLSPEDRRSAYSTLAQHARTRKDALAALTNADRHFCDAYDIEPIRAFGKVPDAVSRTQAKFMTRREMVRAIELAVSLAPTPELQLLVKALVAMATCRPLRPGDIMGLCFEDLEVWANRCVLNLRRRRARKGQKTKAAERPMEFREPSVREALAALRKRREEQCAMTGDPLWGRDWPESHRQFARAQGLISTACKLATGDTFESFYSLRHGVITEAVQAALLMPTSQAAQRALTRASDASSHCHVATTLENYYHRAPEVLHLHAMAALKAETDTRSAAAWTGLTSAALYQRVSRGQDSAEDIRWRALEAAASIDALPHIAGRHPCCPSKGQAHAEKLMLEDILFSDVCMSWQSMDPAGMRGTARMAYIASTERLLQCRGRYCQQWPGEVRKAAVQQAKLAPIVRQLRQPRRSRAATAAIQLWRDTAHKGFLDVRDPLALNGWLQFLSHCGVKGTTIILRAHEAIEPTHLTVLSVTFEQIFGFSPTIDKVPGGKGRPDVYFLLASSSPTYGVPVAAAAVSMVGFNSWMLAAAMQEDMTHGPCEEGL